MFYNRKSEKKRRKKTRLDAEKEATKMTVDVDLIGQSHL